MEFGHTQWRKSSNSSEAEACVEVAFPIAGPRVGIRDSKNPAGGHLTVPDTALHHLTRTCS